MKKKYIKRIPNNSGLFKYYDFEDKSIVTRLRTNRDRRVAKSLRTLKRDLRG